MSTATMLKPSASLPKWTDVNDWEDLDTRSFHAHPTRSDVAITIDAAQERFAGGFPVKYRVRLFVHETFVAAAVVYGPGNFDHATANVLSGIEVKPSERGNRYSVLLLELLQEKIGTVYRTGMVSITGHANMKYLDLPLVPGREVRVTKTMEYSTVDWETSRFKH